MPLTVKTIRTQMAKFAPLLKSCSLDMMRKGQDMIGELIEVKYRNSVIIKEHVFENFKGAWVIPKDERRDGVILYLHGGGYTCGNLDYALGVGSILAVETGTRVFCCAYRLAPEHKFPAAIDDSLEAYNYILSKGYSHDHITLCGESAGGGLCYSVCLRLKKDGQKMPCGIIAISPWTDLTASGSSYAENKDRDPSMTVEQLDFFAKCYTESRTDPLVSAIYANLRGMPPSLIFAAKNEIMFSDANLLHLKLLDSGCESEFSAKDERWHAYVTYCLDEDKDDYEKINKFLNKVMSAEKKLKWLRLDNSAKIYPAARNENWSNIFRLSLSLNEDIDKDVLQSALDVTIRRFPSIAVRLRKGVFWYYLQQVATVPNVREEKSYPLTKMSKRETRKCAFRVLYYKNRIAVELFHSLTDGTGALIFLKSLTAEYLQQKYGAYIPAENGVLGRLEEPSEEELEDSFQKYAGKLSASRKENDAWSIEGTPESGGFINLTCFKLPIKQMLDKAHEYGVSLTVFVCSVLMMAFQESQKEKIPNQNRRKPIKILIPVNLRNLYESKTLRNFALYTTPEILPKLGEYSLEEICEVVKHKMGAEITKKQMSMKIATNINSEKFMAIRMTPLFIKNIVMKAVFNAVGERKSSLSMSNLGAVKLPKEMAEYVTRADFLLGVQSTKPYNCGMISYKDTLYMSIVRNIKEPDLEMHLHRVLQSLGITAEVESNNRSK
ncbi:MAG: alpha/beta hydrolase [Clostridia bacterium]|nr:alpha/beta hydrolase [Clostridia bacterium]